MKKTAIVLAVVCLLAVVPGAMATPMFTVVGDPFEGDSWSQAFNESGVGNFNWIQVEMVAPATLEAPAFRSFSAAGWTYAAGDQDTAVAYQGPTTTNLTWSIFFDGSSATPLAFDFQAFYNLGTTQTLQEDAHAAWTGSAWVITANEHSQASELPVPEPLTMIFFGTGLAGVFGFVARRRMAGKEAR